MLLLVTLRVWTREGISRALPYGFLFQCWRSDIVPHRSMASETSQGRAEESLLGRGSDLVGESKMIASEEGGLGVHRTSSAVLSLSSLVSLFSSFGDRLSRSCQK